MAQEEKAAELDAFERQVAESEDPLDDNTLQKLLLFKLKLLGKIFGNMQLSLRRLHIRSEDWLSNPLQEFSYGLTLENLSVKSTNSLWHPVKPDPFSEGVRKGVVFDSLAFYSHNER